MLGKTFKINILDKSGHRSNQFEKKKKIKKINKEMTSPARLFEFRKAGATEDGSFFYLIA